MKIKIFLAALALIAFFGITGCHENAGQPEQLGLNWQAPPGDDGTPGTTPSGTESPPEPPPPPAGLSITSLKLVRLDGTELELNGTLPIPVRVKVKAVFSEPVNTRLGEISLSLQTDQTAVAGLIYTAQAGADNTTILFTPSANLRAKTQYTAAITIGGAAMALPISNFTTRTAGDVNGDGVPDLIIGAPAFPNNQYKGIAIIYSGQAIAAAAAGSTFSTRLSSIPEGNSGDYRGWSVAMAGDMNADGYEDMAVGSPNSMLFLFGFVPYPTYQGRVTIFKGAANLSQSVLPERLTTLRGTGAFGGAVAPIGDMNNNGYDDIAIGAPFDNLYVGKVFIFDGNSLTSGNNNPLAILLGQIAPGYFGYSVANAGDVDNDGVSDIIIGAPGIGIPTTALANVGGAYVYSGARVLAGDLTPFAALSQITASNLWVGASVAGVGDINNDRFDDIAIGAPGFNGTGSVVIMDGKELQNNSPGALDRRLATLLPTSSGGTYFGYSTAGVGDVDSDGKSDVGVGMPATARGYAGIYKGEISEMPGVPTLPFFALLSDFSTAGQWFGISIASADFDSDGKSDVIVGDPSSNGLQGKVYIYKGANSQVSGGVPSLPLSLIIDDSQPQSLFGLSVSSALE